MQNSIPRPQDCDPSWRQTLPRWSCPGAPRARFGKAVLALAAASPSLRSWGLSLGTVMLS